jgi:hypothetical protein
MSKIDNTEDLIDSRDVIERIEELETEGALRASVPGESWGEVADRDAADYLDDDDADELRALRELAKECANYSDWGHGETLIRDSYFVTYAQELADDIGAVNSEIGWPYSCIDWEKAAWELRMDYTSVEFDGITYWIR